MELIDRQELREKAIWGKIRQGTVYETDAYVVTTGAIDTAPVVDAAPVVHGRWVDNHCTACGMMPMGEELWTHMDIEPPKMERFMDYCPTCGAKMDGGAEDGK